MKKISKPMISVRHIWPRAPVHWTITAALAIQVFEFREFWTAVISVVIVMIWVAYLVVAWESHTIDPFTLFERRKDPPFPPDQDV